MKRTVILGAMVLSLGVFGSAQENTRVEGGDGIQALGNPIDFFPSYDGPADINVWIVTPLHQGLTVMTTDACQGGDRWQTIAIGLPNLDVQNSVTDGSAEGCSCAHSEGYDAMFTVTGPFVGIVIQRYVAGNDDFPTNAELRMSSNQVFQAQQTRGADACGVQ